MGANIAAINLHKKKYKHYQTFIIAVVRSDNPRMHVCSKKRLPNPPTSQLINSQFILI
jgi:hypothetical protein